MAYGAGCKLEAAKMLALDQSVVKIIITGTQDHSCQEYVLNRLPGIV